jgi:hypothetical protein
VDQFGPQCARGGPGGRPGRRLLPRPAAPTTPAGKLEAGTVLVVALTVLHPAVPQPAGSLVYELVFMVDLTGELRAWPQDSWQQVGVDPDQVAQAVVGCWQEGEVTGLQVDDLSFEEARSLTRPAMTWAATSSAAA